MKMIQAKLPCHLTALFEVDKQKPVVCTKVLNHSDDYSGYINSICWSPDGNLIVSGANDHKVRLWHVPSGALINNFESPYPIISVCFSPDGNFIASSTFEGMILIWNAHTGALISTWRGHYGFVNSLSYGPDGITIASGSSNRTVCIWDVRTGRLLHHLNGHSDLVSQSATVQMVTS